MQKINKSGLALGTIFALVSSAFVGVTSASAANETSAVIVPSGSGALTANTIVGTETFETLLRYGTGVVGVNTDRTLGTVPNISIEVVVDSASADVVVAMDADGDFSNGTDVVLSSISDTVGNDGYAAISSASPHVSFSIDGLTSISPEVNLTVTPYIELDGVTGRSSGDSVGDAYTIKFVPWSGLGASVTLGAAIAGNVGATASVTVTAGNIRWSQLNGVFGVAIDSTGDTSTGDSGTISAQATAVASPDESLTGAELVTANYSFSAAVLTDPLTTSGAIQSVSAKLVYFTAAPNHTDNVTAGRVLAVATPVAVTALGVAGVTVSPVAGDNIVRSGANAADARFNSAFSLNVYPYSASITTSVAIASAFTVSAIGSTMELDADSGVIINGTTYTTSAGLAKAGFDVAAGGATIAVSTFGQDEDGSNDSITFKLTSQQVTNTLTVTLKAIALTLDYDKSAVAGLAGASKTFALSVEDQWGVAPVRTDLRVAASVVLGGSTSETVSAAVSGAAATVTVTPVPATRTGSAVVTFTLQKFNQDTQGWDNISGGTDTATWNLYTYAAGTEAFTSRTLSVSASISYGVALSYSSVVAIGVTNSFSDVTATAPGLIIMNADETSETASDTLTIAANGKTANFKFTSRLAGTYTVSFAAGTAVTTSTVVIDVAAGSAGKAIAIDKTTLASGQTTKITGTLTDENGNAVHTSGSADVVVSWAGLGLPFGTGTLETDADGKFSINVLVLSSELGSSTLTATYRPTGDSASTKNVTKVQTITVGESGPEVNAVIGSYQGRWAVRVENAKGSTVTVKVGGNWYKYSALNDNYLFSRKSKVGASVLVKVWVDGELQNEQTITVK